MSSISRGLYSFLCQQSLRLPSSIRVSLFSSRTRCVNGCAASKLTSSPLLRHYVKPSRILQSMARPTYLSRLEADPAIRTVLLTKKPVLLYEGAPSFKYTIKVYLLAGATMAAGLYSLKFSKFVSERKGLVGFEHYTYVFVGICLLAIGTYICSFPVSRCTSIELIPSTIPHAAVQFRIRARTAPFLADKVIVANVGEVTISQKTSPVAAELIAADRYRAQRITEGLESEFFLNRWFEIATRFVEKRWTSFFLNFKFAVTKFRYVPIEVHGDKWKVDCSAYLREDGQALDRLIRVE
ncbi:uncharacterized protein EI97DRAFT_433921 [Westerdykella ornata]|uniref:Uncharacterized protein n=1 Tax=Westerdykella ornata TaxID=318751 RepID=A0A6A6JJ46_WESOR|nr:uncharacterized protein EI97DRAFT_433921 [Westerdykella ornata]KAF2275988.1 hypothetical protein EI97DRAFT_433921 [Westerdykella ornata]